MCLSSKSYKVQRGRCVKYNCFLTKNGLRVTKSVEKSRNSNSKTNISLNVFSRNPEKVLKVKSITDTKAKQCKNCQLKKEGKEELAISAQMERMSLEFGIGEKKRKLEDNKTGQLNISKRFRAK